MSKELTNKEIVLLKFYRDNPKDFIEEFVTKGSLLKGQSDTLDLLSYRDHVIVSKPRQMGGTELVVGYAVWNYIFGKNPSIGIKSRRMDRTIDIIDRVARILKELPDFLQPNDLNIRKCNITSDRGAIGVYGDKGHDLYSHVLMDEYYETILHKAKVLVISSAGNDDEFDNVWKDAINPKTISQFTPYQWDVKDHPRYSKEWEVATINVIGIDRYMVEFNGYVK